MSEIKVSSEKLPNKCPKCGGHMTNKNVPLPYQSKRCIKCNHTMDRVMEEIFEPDDRIDLKPLWKVAEDGKVREELEKLENELREKNLLKEE